jgi:hypothetical protein
MYGGMGLAHYMSKCVFTLVYIENLPTLFSEIMDERVHIQIQRYY